MAEYKDYTNIAGTPFQPYVTKQIEKRKELIKKENRSSSDLQWLTNKNVWIRISSGADVDEDNSNFDDLGEVKGQKLARKYILQGGLFKDTSIINNSGNTQDIKELRAGIGPDGAYGIGGNDFGYRPMPGLTSLSIKTGGKLGTLREATIEFTCYNKKQLDIMSALYMRLGFSVLVEWGHIPYINNTGQLETKPKPLPFFKNANQAGINDKEELMEQIQKNRVLHSGNYDALWGTIKNFTYSLEDNGTFKCQVQLVGAGDILESLKINQSSNTKDEQIGNDNPTIYATIATKEKSDLNKALYEYYIAVQDIDTESYNINASSKFLTLVEKYLKPNLGISFYLNGNTYDWKKNNELQRKGYHFSLIPKLNTIQGNGSTQLTEIPDIKNPQYFFSRLIVGYEINDKEINNDINEPGLEQAYITLGHLLLLVKATGFLYDKKDNKKTPYIYIDVNPETNRCYTFPGHCSLDPTICLIGSQVLPYKIKSEFFNELKEKYPFYDNEYPELGGRFMHTLVNIEFITSTLKKYSGSNKENNVYFVDFLKDILDGISRACGGFNEFRIVPDDDARCIRIFDDRVSSNYTYETAKYLTIPVLGKESIVYGFSYSSKISPQMASQIVIAAQAKDEIKNNKDALSFSHLNEGLTNRLAPSRVESVTEANEENKEKDKLSNQIELRNHLERVYKGVGEALATQDDVNILESELNINAEGVRNFDEVPNDLKIIKNILTQQLEAIFGELRITADNIKSNSEELDILTEARNEVQKIIDDLNSIPKDISNGVQITLNDPNKPTFTSKQESRIRFILTRLTKEYKSPNFSDSIIEKEWQNLFPGTNF